MTNKPDAMVSENPMGDEFLCYSCKKLMTLHTDDDIHIDGWQRSIGSPESYRYWWCHRCDIWRRESKSEDILPVERKIARERRKKAKKK